MEAKSSSNRVSKFIASGSPNLALYSINLTPFPVTINPPYNIPLYFSPVLCNKAEETFSFIILASSTSLSFRKGKEWLASE